MEEQRFGHICFIRSEKIMKTTLEKIADQLHDICKDELTQCEKNIAEILISEGYGKWEEDGDDIVFLRILPHSS